MTLTNFSKNFINKIKTIISTLTIIGFLGLLVYIGRELRYVKRHYRSFQKSYACKLRKGGFERGVFLPMDLQNIPSAQAQNIVLGSKTVNIRNVPCPYNASIIEHKGKYLLFFRYDMPEEKTCQHFSTYVGCAELDKNFNQTEKEFVTIDTKSHFSEDPRAVKIGKKLFLIYNNLHSQSDSCRSMYLAKLNPENLQTEFITELDLQMQPVEKNWIPFEYIDKQGKPQLYLEYSINPHKIFSLANPVFNSLKQLVFPNYCAFHKHLWPKLWGKLRGGSTVQKIDDEQYLGFFHSNYIDKENNRFAWYLMGAYTFTAKPPFKLTSFSNYPIFFDGIYDSPIMGTADPHKRVIFPCSYVLEKKDGKELIHVSCGENDSQIKIITFDKKNLLKSLKKI